MTRTVVIGAAAAVFVACSLLPLAYLLIDPLSGARAASGDLWLDSRRQGLLWNTTLLGAGTAIFATAIGAPLGLALARVPLRGKAVLRLALTTPLLLPPYIVALAWTYLASGRSFLSESAYSVAGAVGVLSLVWYPLSMLATEAAMRRIDGRLEEAALTVAPPPVVLRRVTLPLALPSVLAAALIIFVLAVSEFGVPGLLRVRVYTTEVFTAFAALYDFGRAVLLAVPLLFLSLLVAAVAVAVAGERLITARRVSGARPPLLDDWQGPAEAAALITVAIALGVPLAVLAREASSAQAVRRAIDGAGPAIVNSLLLATIGATAVVSVGLWLGYARARARGAFGRLADVLFVFAFAVPSTIVGVGLIGLWNRPGLFGSIYGTDAMFIVGYLARFVPVAALILAAAIRYVPVSHEEAAAVSGAPWLRTIAGIVVPQIRVGVMAAWMVTFVLAFGELGVSVLVAPPGESTLPIRVYTIIANTPASQVAALALLQTIVILVPVAILAGAVARREPR